MFGLAQEIVRKQFLNHNLGFSSILSLAGNVLGVRLASKKAGGSTRNRGGRSRPKHRRILINDGGYAQKGMLLVTQNKLRFHPGLNVGFGRNATLYALQPGKVVVSCEKIDPNMERSWVQNHYGGRDISKIYKKFINIIPEKQHNTFKHIDSKCPFSLN